MLARLYGWVRRSLDRAVGQHLRWIDENREVPPAAVSANTRCTIVFVVTALCLTLISYAVLSRYAQPGAGATQDGVARALLDALAGMWPEGYEAFMPYRPLAGHLVWALGCFVFYFIIPALVIRVVFRQRLRDYGLSLEGYLRHLWIYALLFLPVLLLVLAVAKNPDFQQQYPFYKPREMGWDFVVWELAYASQFFALEFFFRGFLLHGTKDKLGRFAVLAMVVPYTMIHFRKPMFETLGAVIAGSALGVLSLRTRTIMGGFTIHVAVAISMDIAALAMRP